jgi:predicted Zn-dependent protease with MMP-like domain
MSSAAALDALLDTIEAADECGDVEELRALVAQGRTEFPDATPLLEWEATLAIDDGRFADALALLDAILVAQPDNFATRRERASVLVDLGRFADALAVLDALPALAPDEFSPEDEAGLAYERALCRDRLGHHAAADADYATAARLCPESYFQPARHTRAAFDELVRQALDELPAPFVPLLPQVVVTVQDWPDPVADDPFQLGVYIGVPRDERTTATEDHLDTIVIYQRPHELQCDSPAALATEVRATVLHELAHHFGLTDAQLDD